MILFIMCLLQQSAVDVSVGQSGSSLGEVLAGDEPGYVSFNETEIRHSHPWIEPYRASGAMASTPLARPSGGVEFEDPRTILRYVLSASPEVATVFPSEQYYYFQFALGARVVSGNIRLVDVVSGGFSVGYFDLVNPNDVRVGQFQHGEDGVVVRRVEDAAEQRYVVGVDGIYCEFLLDDRALSADLPLLHGEQIVTGLLDESGYFLILIFNSDVDRFYFVLNPSYPTPEPLSVVEHGGHGFAFGSESRFCFYRHPDTERHVLVGVHLDAIAANSWFDGPFDQVPPRLQIGDLVRRAYPYVEDNGGIDDHGNFLRRDGSRIAISPYVAYFSGPELLEDLARRMTAEVGQLEWLVAVEESKNTWRAPQSPGEGIARHVAALSRAWPANHWGASSQSWSAEHSIEVSHLWPPNHVVHDSSVEEP